MAVRGGAIRRTGEGLLVLVGLGVLSAGVKGDDLTTALRIAAVLVGFALLVPVRRRLSPEAWITDGPRGIGRHVLSACLFLCWVVLLIAVGSTLGEVAGAVVIGPGIAIGFVGSWAAADVITGYFTSAQFTMVESPGDDAVEPAHPST